MQQVTWCLCATLTILVAVTSFVDAQQVVYVSDPNLYPVQQGALSPSDVFGPVQPNRAERQKRKFLEPIVESSFGIKSALLNLIFGKVNQLIDYKTKLVGQLDKKNIILNQQYGLYGQKPCDTPGVVPPTFPGYQY